MATEDKLRDYLKRVTVDLAETRRRLAETEARAHEPIAVIGMACRYAGADTVDAYWDLLRDGRTEVTDDVPGNRYDLDGYEVYTRRGAFLPDITGWDAQFFGLAPQEALRMDPQQRLLMELVWEALEDAGTPAPTLAGSRTGVMIGFSDTLQYARLQAERQGWRVFTDPYLGQGSSASVVAGRLAYHFDLRGPTLALDTACSSSLVAVHLAAQSLRRGECDLALAGGAFLVMQPDVYVYGCATSMLAPDGACKTFDAGANGYVMGEGGGIVVLARLSDAVRAGYPIRAVIRGSAVNQDGHSNGLTAPSRTAQVDVIRRALAAARTSPDEVCYVEAHGSGTKLGDAIELGALHDVFGGRSPQRPLRVGAVKTNIGHTQAAAGIAGLIKTVLVLQHGVVPPNLNMVSPSDSIPDDGTVQPVRGVQPLVEDDRPRIVGVSSFGWSGTNAHVVLEAAPQPEASDESDRRPETQLLPVSATSDAALRAHLDRLASSLAGHDLADVAYTLAHGRAEHEYRRAIVASGTADAATRLANAAGQPGVRRVKGRPRVAFLLPGVGDQYRGLGRDLYQREPVFAAAVDECVALVEQRSGIDLRPLFAAPDPATAGTGADGTGAPAGDLAALLGRTGTAADPADDPLNHAETAHPFLFTVEYALVRLLASWGVTPDLLIGYSLGEYVAACVAGVFSLADALWLVVERARLIEASPTGHMLAVAADADRVGDVLTAGGAEVDIAALNGPMMTVLSGAPDQIDTVARQLADAGIAARRLRSAHAFHSSLLEPARGKLAALVASVPRHAPTIPIVSNVTGTALTAQQAVDAEYWAGHLCRPVRFADGVGYCASQGVDAFVELGAGQTLGGLVRQNLTPATGADSATGTAVVLGTLPAQWMVGESPDGRTSLLETCGRLWELGVALDWAAVRGGSGRIVHLPAYPFQRTRFWPEWTQDGTATPNRHSAKSVDELCYAATWQQDLTQPVPVSGDALALPGPLVVFAAATGVGTRLADLAEAAGTPVVEVVPGTASSRHGRRIVIDPTVAEHYREVFASVEANGTGPVHVVHLWSLLDPASDAVYPTDADLRTAIRNGFDTLLLTVQAVGELATGRGVRLLTGTAGAAEIIGADATAPDRALVHGLGRVVRSEYPGLAWRGVDLDPQGDPADATSQLAAELRRGPWDGADPASEPALIGWRRGRRWLKGWASVPLGDPADAGPWRVDGTYLITGGTRGLGMALAKHLVRSGVRRLALVGRSPVTAEAAADPTSRAAQTLRDIAELEAAGAEVLRLTADVGVPDELRAALRACRDHFGALTGVVHAAGVPAGGMTQRRTVAEAGAVLAPKVLALGPLAELVSPRTPAELRPELLVLYSSAVTVLGGIGEGDYCAANSVLDAYGAALSGAAPSTRVITVAWGPWQYDAWQSDALGGALAERVRAYRDSFGFTEEAGCALLDRLVAGARGGIVAIRQPLADALRDWTAILDLDSLVDLTPAGTGSARFPRPQLRTDYVPPSTELEITIADVWGGYLGIDRVGRHDPFFDLGGNSLVGMAMVTAIEKRLGRRIAPAVLFEHPTVAAFAAALDGARGHRGDADGAQLAVSSARGERRRRARGAQVPGTRK